MEYIKFNSTYSYLYPVWNYMDRTLLNGCDELVSTIIATIPEKQIQIVAKGSSGTVLGTLITDRLIQKNIEAKLIYLRKPNEKTHHGTFKGYIDKECFTIIIDDLISSGKTINGIYDEIVESINPNKLCLAIMDKTCTKSDRSTLKFKPRYFFIHHKIDTQ